MSIEEIRKLTFYQLRNVYFRERDEHGRLVRAPSSPGLSYRDIFWRTWKKRGYNEKQIQARWEKYLKKQEADQERQMSQRPEE